MKDVLTRAQRDQLLLSLALEGGAIDLEEDLPEVFEIDVLFLPIQLSDDQIKKILRHQIDEKIKTLKIGLKITYRAMDLRKLLSEPDPDTKDVNKIIMKITDLVTDLMDNKVQSFLKTKDELTTSQKKMLIHYLFM